MAAWVSVCVVWSLVWEEQAVWGPQPSPSWGGGQGGGACYSSQDLVCKRHTIGPGGPDSWLRGRHPHTKAPEAHTHPLSHPHSTVSHSDSQTKSLYNAIDCFLLDQGDINNYAITDNQAALAALSVRAAFAHAAACAWLSCSPCQEQLPAHAHDSHEPFCCLIYFLFLRLRASSRHRCYCSAPYCRLRRAL